MNRLTEKNKFDTHYGISISKNLLQSAYDKLGKIEDLMEKYEIESIEALEEILKDYDDMAKDIVEMTTGVKVEVKG